MYKRINLTQLEGILFTQDLIEFMQSSYRDAIAALSVALGDYVIITGVELQAGNYTNGWVAINGELLPFIGGAPTAQIIIEEVVTQELYGDGNNKDAYYVRTAKLGNTGGTALASFVRLSSIKHLTEQMPLKSPSASPSFTGVPTAPTAAPGNNTTQLATTAFVQQVKDSLLNGAGAAFDTLIELANALGNDPNFATTVATQLSLKADKSVEIQTGLGSGLTGGGNLSATRSLSVDGSVYRTSGSVGTINLNTLTNAELTVIANASVTNKPADLSGSGFSGVICFVFGGSFVQILMGEDSTSDPAVWMRNGSTSLIGSIAWKRLNTLS
jgi:hypothetical protein